MNPFEQQVRERAYFIWESEGRVFGRAEHHWLTAEAELRPADDSAHLIVRPVTADLSLAPSPAKTLKPRASRSTGAAAKSVAETNQAASAKPVSKTTAAKAPATKAPATKTTATKSAASKSAVAKPRTASKPRAALSMDSAGTVH